MMRRRRDAFASVFVSRKLAARLCENVRHRGKRKKSNCDAKDPDEQSRDVFTGMRASDCPVLKGQDADVLVTVDKRALQQSQQHAIVNLAGSRRGQLGIA